VATVLYLINKRLRMFCANAQGKRLGFDKYLLPVEQFENIARRVSGREYDMFRSNLITISCYHATHTPAFDNNVRHSCLKPHFPAALTNLVAHVADNLRQFVGSDMRVRFHENLIGSTESHEQFQYSVDVAALLRSRVQFPIGISSRATFSKTVIRIGINDML